MYTWSSLTLYISLQADLFSCEIEGMSILEDNYVFVWYWGIAASSAEQDYQESIGPHSDTTGTDSDDSRDRPEDTKPTPVIHTLVFRCIGATKEGPYQERLAEAYPIGRNCASPIDPRTK